MKNEELDNGIITTETKNDFERNECYDIGTQKRLWIRNCPKCNRILFHKSIESYLKQKRKNSHCRICGICEKNEIDPQEFERRLSSYESIQFSIINGIKNWIRVCPNCLKETFYKNKNHARIALREDRSCTSCCKKIKKKGKFLRTCPQCKVEQSYTTEYAKNNAEKKKRICCRCKANNQIGKTFSEETKLKQSIFHKKRCNTKEWKDIISKRFKGIPKSEKFKRLCREKNTGSF